jgi:uncharacterized membrane protein HdeD (DUF308 family)
MKTFNYSLVRIIFAVIIGVVLVAWPDAAAGYLVMTIGALFLVPGIISLIGYFATRSTAKADEQAPTKSPRFPLEAIGSLLFGMWLIIMPDFFADILMYVLGFILIMAGVWQIASLVNARRWVKVPLGFYVVPTLILLAGLFSVAYPSDVREDVFMVLGVTALVFAVSELINWIKFTRKRPAVTTVSLTEESADSKTEDSNKTEQSSNEQSSSATE